MPAVLGVTLLMWVYLLGAVFVVGIVGSIGAGIFSFLTGGSTAAAVVFLFVLMGGVVGWVLSMFWVAVPVCVLEAPGVSASLGRSARLTNGHRWKILGLLFVLLLVVSVPGYLLRQALLPADSWWRADDADLVIAHHGQRALKTYMVSSFLYYALAGPLTAVASAVAYHDLRVSKEGVGVEEIAKVFD